MYDKLFYTAGEEIMLAETTWLSGSHSRPSENQVSWPTGRLQMCMPVPMWPVHPMDSQLSVKIISQISVNNALSQLTFTSHVFAVLYRITEWCPSH